MFRDINKFMQGGKFGSLDNLINKSHTKHYADVELPFYKSLKKIKEYDTIEMSTPINELYGELEKFNPVLTDTPSPTYHSILNEYVLKYRTKFTGVGNKNFDAICYTYVNEIERVIECYTFETVTGLYYCVFRTSGTDFTKFDYKMNKATDKECHIALSQTLSVLGYIQNKMVDTKTIVKSVRRPRAAAGTTAAPQQSKKRTVQILNADKVIYTISSQQDNIAHTVRKYQRHKDSWNVAGHPRKLASGKVVWVKPYQKGTGTPEPKTYKVK